ncbi:hypothetical protein LCGC14_1340420 [marine sediment metagenome]|uniref:Uncharacterized protein n=1 Tax=marine sediment metagenome TaxID=412755 RepID=A0A0F9NG72_9ZZZZ
MNDIYDEQQEMTSAKYLAKKLLDSYGERMIQNKNIDPDERRRMGILVTNWPGTDIAGQLILDAINLLNEYEIDPKNIRW